jgi:hypothetical protein
MYDANVEPLIFLVMLRPMLPSLDIKHGNDTTSREHFMLTTGRMGEERGHCGMTNMKMENREKRAQMNT